MGPKTILNVIGSPRKKGNCALLAKAVAAGAESAGARVETFFLQQLQIAACRPATAAARKEPPVA